MNILYEDNHLIAVYKPANIPTQGDSSRDTSLFDMVKEYIKVTYDKPGNVYLGMVHRLDRPTQGVVIFAKTSKAASRLSAQIRSGDMNKIYYATVYGIVEPEKGILKHFLTKNPDTNTVTAFEKPQKNTKEALLTYSVLTTHTKKNCSSIEINLITGRSHQIRVQFAKIGHPILGDRKYGNNQYKSTYLALVAHSVSFTHPTTKEYITITSQNNESNV